MASSHIIDEPGIGRLEVFPLEPALDVLQPLLTDMFENHWHEIVFGPMVQGAVFEIRPRSAPARIGVMDGYLTVDFGDWHIHLCIGPHKGPAREPTPADVAAHRQCGRAELYRILGHDGAPRSWALRLHNGEDEQMMTVFFPNPYLTNADKILKTPDWSRLAMWDKFRKTYLGLDPDPLDRTAKGFGHAGL